MESVYDEKLWLVARLRLFIERLQKAEESLDIEAETYLIMSIARHAYERMHLSNQWHTKKEMTENGNHKESSNQQ